MKKIGVLELSTGLATHPREYITGYLYKKQFISVTPQAISVWCRQMGHQTYYATFYGIGDPHAKLPSDLNIVFICAPTFLATLAYALAKVYRRQGVRTVIGGPHAKSFPQDCQRYFDLVVLECDRVLIGDIVNDEFAPGSILSSPRAYDEPPTIEERMPEIKASSFSNGRPHFGSAIPMLASVGCPYACNFCTDWNNSYRALSAERLAADLRFASRHLPNVKLYFHDPNFGVRFDETLSVFEAIPPGRRNPYLIESSLKLINSERLVRLRETNCIALAPGIESWEGYSNKAGVGKATGEEKLAQVIEKLTVWHEYIPYLQANFILGLDVDYGDAPFELTKEFLHRAPFVWPHINIPMAFGGTPLFDTLLREERILQTLPFNFYRQPYLTIRLKHYDPLDYFKRLIDLQAFTVSGKMLRRRLRNSASVAIAGSHVMRVINGKNDLAGLHKTVRSLQNDPQMRTYHAGITETLPAFYAYLYQKSLGKYAELMPVAESMPILPATPVQPIMGRTIQLT
jgi:radical SAM superfamily enzyme YgiQ (UPF0313 family)